MSTKGTGFTLLEVLVAFIIAALAVAALLRGASAGLQGAQAGARYQEAVSRAQSRMALLQADLRPGEQRGDDGGGFSWRVDVQPGASVPVPQTAGLGPQGSPAGAAPGGRAGAGSPGTMAERTVLYAVSVSIAWRLDGGEREVTLHSQRLGSMAAEGP